jgi:YegS/Rv2252/BmrU family lipid kinase
LSKWIKLRSDFAGIEGTVKMSPKYKRIHVIINPASGKDEPILNTLNDVFRQYEFDWTTSVTHKYGEATHLAQQAVANGVDLVVGYGGDGTQMEIANGVMGSDTPMAILPGGTGNAMTFELKIPRDLKQAAELICQSDNRRKIDVGRIGDRHFMLRAYAGPAEEQVASREMKDRYGLLAYPAASMRLLKELPLTRYQLTIDGQEIKDEGIVCYIFNAGSMGGVDVPTPEDISASDGMLDVFMVNRSRAAMQTITSYALNVGKAKTRVHRWQGKEITVQADPPQTVWIDGEAHGQTPFTATVIPKAVQIVVPRG